MRPQVQGPLDPMDFVHGSVCEQDNLKPKPSTGETLEIHEYVNCCYDMTEKMLKAA